MTHSSSNPESSRFAELWCNADQGCPQQCQLSAYDLGWLSRPCPTDGPSERTNEDSAAALVFEDGSGIVAVADGMGGHAGGALASSTAIQALLTCVQSSVDEGLLLRTGIITGFEEANARVQACAPGAGTTLAVAELGPGFVRPYHCGDSVVLQTGNRGKLKLLTTSHSPVAMAVEAGFLNEEEAMFHPQRHLVSNALGMPEMKIEVGSAIAFRGRDTLLLASDGLTDNLGTEEIVAFIRKGPLAASLGRLADRVWARMHGSQGLPSKPDDLTLLAVRCRRPTTRPRLPPPIS